jgi:hypothetical protein
MSERYHPFCFLCLRALVAAVEGLAVPLPTFGRDADGADTCLAREEKTPARILPNFSLILVCALLLSGCVSTNRKPEPTVEYIRDTDIRHYRGGSQIYDLSPRQRSTCEKRAAAGDIVAAKTLVEYHEMITRDSKQYRHWLRVVARLQKAYQKHHWKEVEGVSPL